MSTNSAPVIGIGLFQGLFLFYVFGLSIISIPTGIRVFKTNDEQSFVLIAAGTLTITFLMAFFIFLRILNII